MHVKLSDEDLRLRQELRDYFDRLLTNEVRAGLHAEGEAGGPVRDEVMRQIGADGWFAIGWPEEFGGQDRGHRAQFILYSEAYRAQAPLPMVTLTTVAPTIMSHGSQEQKDYFLPKIAAGELVFSIGYTEPEAGTDLASLRTAAVREGEEFVINGSKIWGTWSRLDLAGCADEPGSPQAQGHLPHPRADHGRRILRDADRGARPGRDLGNLL